ncbi:thermosome subunit beta [Halohasta litorea]|uniref:Thermosome subunit beta n=1 Tax=Halohasta litorea TaxID=869891 RepID=A0ABD6D6W0_9EURY|nr:thermosome subunit beta [Halohasta litorea]
MSSINDSVSHTQSDESGQSPLKAGIALAETVHSTLGPNGMDKMLIDDRGRVVVTNDGARVLDRLDITEPIGRVLKHTVQRHQQWVGDGSTTTLLLIGELLSAARSLQEDGLHPTTIVDGYYQATMCAREQLLEYAHSIDPADDDVLQAVATTAVTGRWDDQSTDRFGSLALSALRAVDFEPTRLAISAYPGGELRDSRVIDGLLVDLDSSSTTIDLLDAREFRTVSAPRIALIGSELAVDAPTGVETLSISDADQAAAFRSHDQQVRDGIVDRLQEVGATVVCCQKSIDQGIRATLAAAGILTVERTRQDEFDTIAQSTGATAVQSVEELTPEALGRAESVQQRTFGTTDTLLLRGCSGQSQATLLLRGGTPHVSDEMERILQTATAVVTQAAHDGSVVPGGAASAMAISQELSQFAETVSGREQLAVRAFGEAVAQIPRVLATNAGANPIDTLAALRTKHDAGATTVGIDPSGSTREMVGAGVVEPRTVFDRCLVTALEAAATLLRIDSVRVSEESPPAATHDSHTGHSHDSHPGHDHGNGSHAGGYPWALSH